MGKRAGTIDVAASLLDDALVADIEEFVVNHLKTNSCRTVVSKVIAEKFMSDRTPELQLHHFTGALSLSIKEKRFQNLKMYWGKMGGVGIDDGKEVVPRAPRQPKGSKTVKAPTNTAAKPIVIQPAEIETKKLSIVSDTETCHLATDVCEYTVPLNQEKLISLLVPIFNLEEDEKGVIEIGDRKFDTNDENVLRYIENFAMAFMKELTVENDSADDSEVEEERKSA